jgi:hypothetical protein
LLFAAGLLRQVKGRFKEGAVDFSNRRQGSIFCSRSIDNPWGRFQHPAPPTQPGAEDRPHILDPVHPTLFVPDPSILGHPQDPGRMPGPDLCYITSVASSAFALSGVPHAVVI